MANLSSDMATPRPNVRAPRSSCFPFVLLVASMLLCGAVPAAAQDRMFFSATDNAQAEIVRMINAETVRLDIATWYLNDGEITQAILNKHLAGVPVRLIGDRGSIFEADPNT